MSKKIYNLGKVKGRTPYFRLAEKLLEIKYDDETVWSTLVDFSTIASSFDLRLNGETLFLEAKRDVNAEWEQVADLSELAKAHEHSNKDVLDKITSSVFEQVKDAILKRHKHDNIGTLNQINDEHIQNIDKIPEIEENVTELINNPSKQLVEGIFYTDEKSKGFSANKNAVPTADNVWIEGNASSYTLLDEGVESAILNVVTTSSTKSSTTTVTIDIVCTDSDYAAAFQTNVNKEFCHVGIVFADTSDKTFYIKVSSATVSGTTVTIKFTFIDGQDTFPITGNITRAIQSIYVYPKNGIGSHSEGLETIAAGMYSHVQGRYNEVDTASNYAHIVGNGTDDEHRSNAHTLDWEGNAWYAGGVEANKIVISSSEYLNHASRSQIFWSGIVMPPHNVFYQGEPIIKKGQWYAITIDSTEAIFLCETDGVIRQQVGDYEFVADYTMSGTEQGYFLVKSTNESAENISYTLEHLETSVDVLSYLYKLKDSIPESPEIPEGGAGLTEEQAANLTANTEARHEHENKDVIDSITDGMLLTEAQKLAINNDTVPIVTELPTDAKFGDLCRYAKGNKLSIDDAGKTIYFNQNWMNEVVLSLSFPLERKQYYWGLKTADDFYEISMVAWTDKIFDSGDLISLIITTKMWGWSLYYRREDDGTVSLITNNDMYKSQYIDSKGSVPITEVPKSLQIPDWSYVSVTNAEEHIAFNLFYTTEPKLMIYSEEWGELPSKAEVEALSEARHTHENKDVLENFTEDTNGKLLYKGNTIGSSTGAFSVMENESGTFSLILGGE